ncbi:GntR family transcriptional regulator [Clostridium amylolyticum]|uniref:GntR family transcriptional regulator n=1 Tax=Clostridium amylolyticum TaxID=1121298 RepID=A0A1M6GH66_9CLOT|nr:GntR family transcriptional regulator [Clostridium amylolyticum]SHJ09212.1 GntR family transcriptional regulator [Clostridium amylolyticum]
MIDEFRNRPREEASEKIEFYIIQNQLKPHDKLPSERDMCTMWGFNRTTLRGAIQNLIILGKLYNKKGSGTYVAPNKLERDLQDLKPFSATVSEAEKNLETKVVSKRILESTKQISQKLKILLGHKVLELIRVRIVDDEPIMIEISYLDYEKFQRLDEHDFSKESLYKVIEKNYDIKIEKGNEKIGITYATEDEAELLQIKEGEPLYFLTGVVTDDQGFPVEYFKSVSRADKIRFSSRLTR